MMVIARVLEEWLSGAPGRKLTLSHTDGKWRVALNASTDQKGEDLLDALGQAAQVAAMGGP